MPEYITGIEFNKNCVRAVKLERQRGEILLVDKYISPPIPSKAEAVPENELYFINKPEGSEWLFSEAEGALVLPSELFLSREIELPFSDHKKVSQLIRLEAEGYFPFPLDEYLIEFFFSSQTNGASQIMLFCLKRGLLANTLERTKEYGLDPVLVGVEGLNLFLLGDVEFLSSCYAYLKLGYSSSVFLVVNEGKPFFYRRFGFGKEKLLRALCENFSISQEESEELLLKVKFSSEELQRSEEESELFSILTRTLEPFLLKLKQCFHYIGRFQRKDKSQPVVESIVICGDCAVLDGLDSYIENSIGISCTKFRIPDKIKCELELTDEEELCLAEPISVALAQLWSNKPGVINFRRGEFAYQRRIKMIYKQIAFPATLVALILILFFVRVGITMGAEEKKANQIRAWIKDRFAERFPQSSITDPTKQLEQKLAQLRSKYQGYKDLFFPSAMEAFAAVSEQVPQEIYVDLLRFNYAGNKVRLEGETTDFSSAKAIVDELSKNQYVKKAVLEDSRTGTAGRVQFVIQIELKGAEEKLPPEGK